MLASVQKAEKTKNYFLSICISHSLCKTPKRQLVCISNLTILSYQPLGDNCIPDSSSQYPKNRLSGTGKWTVIQLMSPSLFLLAHA